MRAFETGRNDIQVIDGGKIIEGRPVRLVMISAHGDSTSKALSNQEAINLAEALLKAAGIRTDSLTDMQALVRDSIAQP